jgi:hypothetical protein
MKNKNRCLTFLITSFGTLLIIFLWLPTHEYYYRSDIYNIQQANDVDTGFLLRFYSPSTHLIGQDYAYKHVALAGGKKIGYTKFDDFRLKINCVGFLPNWFLSICIFYAFHKLLCYLKGKGDVSSSKNNEQITQTNEN